MEDIGIRRRRFDPAHLRIGVFAAAWCPWLSTLDTPGSGYWSRASRVLRCYWIDWKHGDGKHGTACGELSPPAEFLPYPPQHPGMKVRTARFI